MIRRVFAPDEIDILPRKGVEAQKIRTLFQCYGTEYDFCRFYVSENLVLCDMDGSFVLCETRRSSDIEELSDFLELCGFAEVFCSEELGVMLAERLGCCFRKADLMRFEGEALPNEEIELDPTLDEVYNILKTAFDIEYEPWYADMSHRIRHNVAKARKLGDSALIIQHDINGEALLSQIATIPESRRRGNASRLIKAVCGELSGSEVYLLCDNELSSFYRKLGFLKTAEKRILYN